MTATFAKTALAALALATGIAAQSTGAAALSNSVKFACMADYFSYCSQHNPEGSGVRQCMRANGLKLSNRCVNALVAAGEVSKSEVASRRAAAN